MSYTLYTVSPSSLKVEVKDVLRYLSIKEPNEEMLSLIYSCIEQSRGVISPRAVYVKCPIEAENEKIDFGAFQIESKNLASFLDGSKEAYVFAATLGASADREVNKYLRTEPSRGVIINAVMVLFIEELCDRLNGYLLGVDSSSKRFSPGYGDLKLEHQRDVMKLLCADKTVGITLTDACLMVPTKSVSAIVAIK